MNNQELAQKWKVSSIAVDGIVADYLAGQIAHTNSYDVQNLEALRDAEKSATRPDISGWVEVGQVAPQATVEPLTDEQIKAEYSNQLYRKNDLHEPIGDVIVATVRALLAATPPTSKATEPFAGLQAHVARQERENAIDPAYGAWLDERAKQGIEAHGGNEVWDAAIRHSLATSKADTGEQIRNADETFGFDTVVPSLKMTTKCTMCDGNGKFVFGEYTDEYGATIYKFEHCDKCNGTGAKPEESNGEHK